MFTIEDKEITLTRGDTAIIDFVINQEFTEGDVCTLAVKKLKIQSHYDMLIQASYYESNTCKFYITADDSDIFKGKYYYDIQINFADGRVDTVINNEIFRIVGEICNE